MTTAKHIKYAVLLTGHKDGIMVREQALLTPDKPCPQENFVHEVLNSLAVAFPELTAISILKAIEIRTYP